MNKRRLREAEKKSNRGNTGQEFRARYAPAHEGIHEILALIDCCDCGSVCDCD